MYSLFATSEANPRMKEFSMLLCAVVTWTNGLYARIPQYAIVDFVLSTLTVFHIFVAFSFVSVADAFYKKPLMSLHRSIAKVFYDIPCFVPLVTLALTYMAAILCWKAYQTPEDSASAFRAMVSVHTWVCSIFLQKTSRSLVKMGVDFSLNAEREVERHDIKAWRAPPKWTGKMFAPLNWLLRPELVNTENIPTDNPGLYVMNHATMGLEMIPFVGTVYTAKDVFLRGLGDNIHFGSLVGEFIRYFGSVNGTRANVDALMENKDNVLVYPGGGHEILKPCAVPNYTLMWRQRLGFARLAIKHGYPIVPCCSVGTEDMLDRLFDIDLGFFRKDQKCPVVFVSPHKLQKVYFWFGEPIPTTQYNGDWKNDEFAKEVRVKAKAAVEAGIRELQQRQATDPNRFLFAHMVNATKGAISSLLSPSLKEATETQKVEPAPSPKKLD